MKNLMKSIKAAPVAVNQKIEAIAKKRKAAAKKSGIKPPTALELKALETQTVKLAKKAGENSITKDLKGKTVAEVAATNGKKVYKTLTGKGAKVNLLNQASFFDATDERKATGLPGLASDVKSYQMKAIAAKAKLDRDNLKTAVDGGAPDTPLTKAFIKAGYVYARTEKVNDGRDLAHGYRHPDGSAVIFTHAVMSDAVAARWVFKYKDGGTLEGTTAKEFVAAMNVGAVPANVLGALELFGKLTKSSFSVVDLIGDDNYKGRVQLLKKLKNTDKILVKESSTKHVLAALNKALNTATLSEANMKERCEAILKQTTKAKNAVRKVEKEEISATLTKTAHTRVVGCGKPILAAPKKLSKKAEAKDSAEFKAALAARVRNTEEEERIHPVATPRPNASIDVVLADICILEDPNNGIAMLMLEKPNSQGAICVYNNGSRVAAGVIPTEVLNTLRPLTSQDLVRDVNQLLNPITAGVLVTPGAERHLTAVLDRCKELHPMATATETVKTKKFAAPAGVAKKNATKATPKTATAKKSAHDKGERAARVTTDRKIKALVNLKSEGLPREGSFCYGQVQAVIGSKTVSEAQAKLDAGGLNPTGRKLEVAWLTKKGYIQVAD